MNIENIVSSGAKKATAKKAAPKKEEAKEVEAPAKEASVDYSSMTVSELKEVAKDKGISGISSMKKAELIEAISKA